MELLKQILGFILKFLDQRQANKREKEEAERIKIEQALKTEKQLEERKKKFIKPKPPTDDDFFGDGE